MNIDYIKEFNKYSSTNEYYSYNNIPVTTELFIIGEEDFKTSLGNLRNFLLGNTIVHPNNYLPYRVCEIKYDENGLIDVLFEVNNSSRFHAVYRKLLKSEFIACIEFTGFGIPPYLIVTQKWYIRATGESYSSYALIDFIDIKEMILENGVISKNHMLNLKNEIDNIATKYSHCIFLTFSDNILIKTNWSADKKRYPESYKPEEILNIVNQLFTIIRKCLGCSAYAVVTEGENVLENDDFDKMSMLSNHYFLGSIATPFVEIFDIEKAIRDAISQGEHEKFQLYISEALLHTLNFKDSKSKEKLLDRCYSFDAIKSKVLMNYYLPIDFNVLNELLD